MIYFLELRRRIVHIFIAFGLLFLLFFLQASTLFARLMHPLLKILPKNSHLIATQMTTPLVTPLALAADAALLCVAPFILFHTWRFVAPALYRHERHSLAGLILGSLGLFCVGILVCFYFILPPMLLFFVRSVPSVVHFMPDMASAVDFITRMLLIFGLCFQVPLICMMLVRLNWLQITTLQQFRAYVIIAAFTIGMLLTPPDVLSQIMLAVPLCILYELGILLAKLFAKSR